MKTDCPFCGQRIELETPGQYQCPRCKEIFTFSLDDVFNTAPQAAGKARQSNAGTNPAADHPAPPENLKAGKKPDYMGKFTEYVIKGNVILCLIGIFSAVVMFIAYLSQKSEIEEYYKQKLNVSNLKEKYEAAEKKLEEKESKAIEILYSKNSEYEIARKIKYTLNIPYKYKIGSYETGGKYRINKEELKRYFNDEKQKVKDLENEKDNAETTLVRKKTDIDSIEKLLSQSGITFLSCGLYLVICLIVYDLFRLLQAVEFNTRITKNVIGRYINARNNTPPPDER